MERIEQDRFLLPRLKQVVAETGLKGVLMAGWLQAAAGCIMGLSNCTGPQGCYRYCCDFNWCLQNDGRL